MKPVLLIIIDALTSRVVVPAMERDQLPTMAALAQAGTFRSDCVSIFPSITPAATASIVTGCYPAEHGIAGAYWYDEHHDHVIYYGSDIWGILRKGLGEFVEDFLVNLNRERLRTPTLMQEVERANLDAATLNYLIFRGDVTHQVKVPLLLHILPGVPSSKTVDGPSGLLLGDFTAEGLGSGGQVPKQASGIQDRFGFDDDHTAEVLLHLARTRTLSDLTVAYFPDNDYRSHEVGPKAALDTVSNVDCYLGQLADAFGGLDQLLNEMCVIITGDHSQCDIVASDEAGITLNHVLDQFALVTAGTTWNDGDDIMVCLNLRTAQLYFRQANSTLVSRVVEALLKDSRIDQVLWKPSDFDGEQRRMYIVATRDRGMLCFWPVTDGQHMAVDQYGGAWSWEGDLTAVDGQLNDGKLMFPNYPNAFERIVGALDHQGAGSMWVTARSGYSFHLSGLSGDEIHAGGGSHGTLHVLDSLAPLFVAGAPEQIDVPPQPRTIDIVPLCRVILGLEMTHELGASRIVAE